MLFSFLISHHHITRLYYTLYHFELAIIVARLVPLIRLIFGAAGKSQVIFRNLETASF